MKISKEEYADYIESRSFINRLHDILDGVYVSKAENFARRVEEAKARSDAYDFPATIELEKIYSLFGWEFPVVAKLIRSKANAELKEKFPN
jgi:hypothetical protein